MRGNSPRGSIGTGGAPGEGRERLRSGWILVIGGVLGLAPLVAQGERPPTGEPGEPPFPPGAARTAAGPLEIRALQAGAGPFSLAPGSRVASSFVTDSASQLTVTAEAVPPAGEAGTLTWEIEPPVGFVVPPSAATSGPTLRLRLDREPGRADGRSGQLVLAVTARWATADRTDSVTRVLRQDLRDRLRQEYVDLGRDHVPDREELLDEPAFEARFGREFPEVRFSDLNHSRIPGTEGERYPFILADGEMVGTVARTFRLFGRRLTVTSGFRNPVRQEEVHAPVDESHHQYGRAADIYVEPGFSLPVSGVRLTWDPWGLPSAEEFLLPPVEAASPSDWLKLAAGTLRAGGRWVEPMTQCHVNTDACHVHVDVRGSGPSSRLFRVAGTVRERAGRPVSGIPVELAGMSATTDPAGRFLLKHVLIPGEHVLRVQGDLRIPVLLQDQPGPLERVTNVDVMLDASPSKRPSVSYGSPPDAEAVVPAVARIAPAAPGPEPAAVAGGLVVGAVVGVLRSRRRDACGNGLAALHRGPALWRDRGE